MSRLTKDEHLSPEFITTWPQYALHEKTRALLTYARKLTESPDMLEDSDVETLRAAGWDERGIYEATALVSFFNFTGRTGSRRGHTSRREPRKNEESPVCRMRHGYSVCYL